MKKIVSKVNSFSMMREVRHTLFGAAYDCSYDIFLEDDGSVRIYPHKISFDEAVNLAAKWLAKNDALMESKTLSYIYNSVANIVVCVYSRNHKIVAGAAKFNDKDPFYSLSIGKALAYSRASGVPLPDDLAAYLGIKQ